MWIKNWNGNLDYDTTATQEEAFDSAWYTEEYSEHSRFMYIERPDGSIVDANEYEQWAENKSAAKRAARDTATPPKPPVATLIIKAPIGTDEHRTRLDEGLVAEVEYNEAVKLFGTDRVTLECHDPTTLVWVGTYERKRRTNTQQQRINESREFFGHNIETPAHTHEDTFDYKAEWRTGEHTTATLTEYSTAQHKAVVIGTNRERVEAELKAAVERLTTH